MFASTCRRRLLLRLHLRQILAGGGTRPIQPNPSNALLSHGYSSSALADVPGSVPCPATISYLVSCGVSPAAAAACKARIHSVPKADAVCVLLRRYGFSGEDFTEIVRRAPLILTLDPERILRPKLELFASLGVPLRTLATRPLLRRSLDNHLIPCIQFLRGIIGTDKDVCHAIVRSPRALTADLEKNMVPAVDTLRLLGLPEKSISKLLIIGMDVLLLSPDRLREIFEYLKALGLALTDKGFVYGIRVFSFLSRETLLRKVALYRSFGVSEDELRNAMKKQPTMMMLSDENIKKKLRFFLDELKLEVSDVMAQPVLTGYSLEKCIIPRCAVLIVLMREGKIEPDIKLPAAIMGSAKYFSNRYVLRYAHDVPDVVKAYEGKIKFEGFRDRDVLVKG